MNEWRIYVAGIALNVKSNSDYEALRETGLFGRIEQIDYFQTLNTDNLWIYRVELNGKMETAVIKRTEQEQGGVKGISKGDKGLPTEATCANGHH